MAGSGTTVNCYVHIFGAFYTHLISDGSGSIFLTGTSNLEDGNVHKICIVVDRTNNLGKTYIDGSEENSQDISSLIGNFDAPTARVGTTSGQYPWQFLSQVVVWNRALMADEVASL